jgi:hypothetical protein
MKFFSSLEDGFQNPYKFEMDFHKVMIQMKLHRKEVVKSIDQ